MTTQTINGSTCQTCQSPPDLILLRPCACPPRPAEPVTAFVCGPRRDHVCDSDGPFLHGGEGVPTVQGRPPEGARGYTWGSVSCSVCGTADIDAAMWRDL